VHLHVGWRVPGKEVQPDTLHPLQMWGHPLGISRISETNMAIRNERCEDNTTKVIHTKRGWGCGGGTVAMRSEREQRKIALYSAFGKSLCNWATVRRFGCQYRSCR
jgi:hypothetical protein